MGRSDGGSAEGHCVESEEATPTCRADSDLRVLGVMPHDYHIIIEFLSTRTQTGLVCNPENIFELYMLH